MNFSGVSVKILLLIVLYGRLSEFDESEKDFY